MCRALVAMAMVRLGWMRSRRSAVRCMADSRDQAGRGPYRSRLGGATGQGDWSAAPCSGMLARPEGRQAKPHASARARSLDKAGCCSTSRCSFSSSSRRSTWHYLARRAAGSAAPRRHSLRERAVLHVERAAVRAGCAGIGAGRPPDRPTHRPPAPRVSAGEAALAIGVLINVGILVHYKYTRFLIENLNGLLHGIPVGPIPVPAILLPIGVSFIVFEKITYLVDIYRGISRPAQRLATYLLYVFFFPKLLAGPIIKYHEMESQLRALPTARFDDISAGFLRFMIGVAKKTLIADTLATGADQIFTADPARVGFAHAWSGVLLLHLPDLLRLLGLFGHGDRHRPHARLPPARELRPAVHRVQHHRVLAPLAHLADHLDPRISLHPAWRQSRRRRRGSTSIYGSASLPPACGTARHGPMSPGAPTTACSWCSTGCSCSACWTACRDSWQTSSPSQSSWSAGRSSAHTRWSQAFAFLRAMMQPGLPGSTAGVLINADVTICRGARRHHLRAAADARVPPAAALRLLRARMDAGDADRPVAGVRAGGWQGGRRSVQAVPVLPVLICAAGSPG